MVEYKYVKTAKPAPPVIQERSCPKRNILVKQNNLLLKRINLENQIAKEKSRIGKNIKVANACVVLNAI
ncbi:MAG: hypothetical protein PHC31_12830 [Clostridia bacterium]|jgi:hypothetical protein|nr:hypothetical protein [Clostridia bacterium]